MEVSIGDLLNIEEGKLDISRYHFDKDPVYDIGDNVNNVLVSPYIPYN